MTDAPTPTQADRRARAQEALRIIYAHHVIKYDPDAAERVMVAAIDATHVAALDAAIEVVRECAADLAYVKETLRLLFEARGRLRDGVLASRINMASHRLADAQKTLARLEALKGGE